MADLEHQIGSTPLVLVDGVFAKLECVNPCGSVKDRVADYILKESERRGLLRPGMRIVEATSGNMGIAVAFYGREMGYPVTIVMPEDMTEERKAIIRGLGAELILVSKEGSFGEAVVVRDRMREDPLVFSTDQFANPLNVECHEKSTGMEILRTFVGRPVDAFVAGVGTGGTLIGVGKSLRRRFPWVRVVAVEPEESAVMSGGEPGRHGIFGIGDGFVPPIASDGCGGLHPLIDSVERVSTEAALEAAKELRADFHFCCGTSSGANFAAARRLRSLFRTVVTVFPDGFSKYVSQGLSRCKDGCAFEAICPDPVPARRGFRD